MKPDSPNNAKGTGRLGGFGALLAGCLAAVLASTCCLGPLVLITLGITGAWISKLTLLEAYQPLFIGAAVAALFFADPAATIVGSHFGGRKLPHNRSKSIYGTLAFFLSLALVGYFLLGFLAVPFAAILAIAESVKWAVDGWAVDDNVAISVIYAAIYLLFISL